VSVPMTLSVLGEAEREGSQFSSEIRNNARTRLT